MKENKLSVWTFPYRKKYYLTHPWKWFNDLYWNIRNFWHRGRYGFAYIDAWNFCEWYPRVAAAALRHIRDHGCGYPGVKPWETFEAWHEYLDYLAKRLDRCADCQDILFGEDRNEYKDELDEIMRRRKERIEHDDGSITIKHTLTPEEEEIRKKYWEREKEIHDADQAYIEETYNILGKILQRIWD